MQDVGCAILVLWFPLLLALIMWSLGLCLVLTVPPFTFLSVLGLWILGWPLVVAFLPVAYILGFWVDYDLNWTMDLLRGWISQWAITCFKNTHHNDKIQSQQSNK